MNITTEAAGDARIEEADALLAAKAEKSTDTANAVLCSG